MLHVRHHRALSRVEEQNKKTTDETIRSYFWLFLIRGLSQQTQNHFCVTGENLTLHRLSTQFCHIYKKISNSG